MFKSGTTITSFCIVIVFLFLYFGLTTKDQANYHNNFSTNIDAFAQEENKPPVVKNSKIIKFSGINYEDIANSGDINPNSFTVSVWFNTAMNVTGKIDNVFLLNKGGFGSDRPGFNLNYGLWLNNREKVAGGFETSIGDDYFVTSQGSYADGVWHNAILTFDDVSNLLKLYIDGVESATNTPNKGTTPDNTGKQPIRLGANSLVEKGLIKGNYTGQLNNIQVWDYAFTKEQIGALFNIESKISR
ncbi:MAG TPA: LamG domain-containing protein [Nitrososphaeraceae archaeon]|nr:LamG domain-containing protein [Nitrososphaeraceae archaeon]